MKKKFTAALAALLALGMSGAVQAQGYDDGSSSSYYKALKGKLVVFVPISMGMDIAAGFAAAMKRAADDHGFRIQIKDPNWQLDQGVQAITQAIDEKPDLLVVQNLDMQAYARVLQRATQAGLRVLQVNVKSTANTTSHVGTDWYRNAELGARKLVEKCSPKNGGNGQIAVLQGMPNTPTNFIGMKAFNDVMKANPDMKVVSNQSADWDASKANSVVSTVLRQNPDLCGYQGFWDGQDSGLAAAVKEAKKTGKIFVVSQGGGESAGCAKVADGSYDYYVSYNVAEMGKVISDAMLTILQQDPKEKVQPFALYPRAQELTKATLGPGSCWTLDQIKRGF